VEDPNFQPKNLILATINGQKTPILIDSGAIVSCISQKFADKLGISVQEDCGEEDLISSLPAEAGNADEYDANCDAENLSNAVDSNDSDGEEVKSRSGKIWLERAPTARRRGPEDIVRDTIGLSAAGENIESVADFFRLFITTEIVQLIVRHTNEESERVYEEYNRKHPTNQKEYVPFDEDELYACMGLLILAGVLKGKHENYRDLWGDVGGRSPFIATLSRDRCQLGQKPPMVTKL